MSPRVSQKTGALRVGAQQLSADEVESYVSDLADYLVVKWPPHNHTRYFPVLIDNSLESHLVLLAMGRLGINCALIESGLAAHHLADRLGQLGESEGYRPSELMDASRSWLKTTGAGRVPRPSPLGRPDARPGIDGSLVIFTSGSAGSPNGVVFPWAQIFDILAGGSGFSSIPASEAVVLNLQPLHWSVGLFQVLSASLGHSVVTLDPLAMPTSRLLTEIALASPTTLYLGADFARVLGNALAGYEGHVVSSVARFAVGAGSVMWEDLVPYRKLIPENATFLHTYGASEAVGMMAYACLFGDAPSAGRVPLGEPRTTGGIRFEPTDEPTIFEVHASARIASGYLSLTLTDQRFVEDDDGTKWWRSGDQVRLDPETHEFHYQGRLDDLVKVNDRRVSLVEMEMALRAAPTVKDAVVRAVNLGGRNRIVAFFQSLPGQNVVESELVAFLEGRLSGGSKPHLLLSVSEIPYTSRHKPDSERLEALVTDAFPRPRRDN